MQRVLTSLILCCLTTFAAAKDCPEDVQSYGVNGEWCEEHAYREAAKAADEKLNAIYKKLIHSVRTTDRLNETYNEEAVSELREAQRAWLKYYEKHCGSAYTILTAGSPSTRMSVHQECRLKKIEERIEELQKLYRFSESSK